MKIICAWCQKIIGYQCPLCGDSLTHPDEPQLVGRYMMCQSEPTQILFSIETMKTTHGLCNACADKLNAERERQRQTDRELSPEDRANLSAEVSTKADTDV